jgi:hypothetical protein
VLEECLRYASEHGCERGVWGGMTWAQRRRRQSAVGGSVPFGPAKSTQVSRRDPERVAGGLHERTGDEFNADHDAM